LAVDTLRSPWPAILERLPEYEPDTLLLSLEFYREYVLRRLIDEDGRQSLALVDIAEVARALLAGVSLSSGILPGDEAGPNSLFWEPQQRLEQDRSLGRSTYLAPGSPQSRARRQGSAAPPTFPGLLFVCRPDASGAYVFAAPKRPRGLDALLFHCPTPNVFPNSRICPGDHAFARDPLKLPSEFFLCRFRNTGDTRGGKSKRHPDDVTCLWDELSGHDTFLADDLVPNLNLQQAWDIAL